MLIIKKLRLQRGWTQAELAAVFDLDISDFSQEDSMKMEDVSLVEQRALSDFC